MLNMSKKDLSELPKEAVDNAVEARVSGVDISKNRFETIPEVLEPVLPQISQLDVSFNRIEASIGLKAEWAFEIFELYAVFCKSSWSLE